MKLVKGMKSKVKDRLAVEVKGAVGKVFAIDLEPFKGRLLYR